MTQPVLISYARGASLGSARALADALGPQSAFLDEADLDTGSALPSGIAEALLGARVVVVFATERYFTRWYCLRELDVALAPYRSLVDARASDAAIAKALQPVVVALLDDSGPEVVDQLPPGVRTTLMPGAADTERLAALVRNRMAARGPTLGERMASFGLDAVRDVLLEPARIPAPRSLAGLRVWGPPGEPQPSLGDGFVGRADELWRIHRALSVRRGDAQMAGLTGSLEGGGGFGKTRLATEYLHRYGPTFYPGGLFWVRADLEPLTQLHGLLSFLEPAIPGLKSARQ